MASSLLYIIVFSFLLAHPASTRAHQGKMGQSMPKQSKKDGAPSKKDAKKEEELKTIMENYITEHYTEFETAVQTWDGFYHVVYQIVEHLSEKSGAIQFKLPSIEKIKSAYNEVYGSRTDKLTKEQLRDIVSKVITLDSFYVGQGARDIFLYIFGVPIFALLAKRTIPGPTRAISDDVFIPLATSGTVFFLSKTNRL